MKSKYKATFLAGLFALLFPGCAGTVTESDFGKISTTQPGHSTDPTRSGEQGGLGFTHRY